MQCCASARHVRGHRLGSQANCGSMQWPMFAWAVRAANVGAFERLSKAISVPPGCDLSRCSVTVELLSQGIVYIDEVRLEWSSVDG